MSYTNQKVIWEPCGSRVSNLSIVVDINEVEERDILENDNGSIMDEYGDIKHPVRCEIRARKQPHESVLRTADGKELLTKSYFYVDPRLEPNALSIAKMDKLDGETVMERYIMCDLNNKPKMVRYITI